MGCCQPTVPPPAPELVGTWALNPDSLNVNTGYGYYRVKKRMFVHNLPDSLPRMRITISPEGFINYFSIINR